MANFFHPGGSSTLGQQPILRQQSSSSSSSSSSLPPPQAQWTRCPTGEEAFNGQHTPDVNENALYNHGMERGARTLRQLKELPPGLVFFFTLEAHAERVDPATARTYFMPNHTVLTSANTADHRPWISRHAGGFAPHQEIVFDTEDNTLSGVYVPGHSTGDECDIGKDFLNKLETHLANPSTNPPPSPPIAWSTQEVIRNTGPEIFFPYNFVLSGEGTQAQEEKRNPQYGLIYAQVRDCNIDRVLTKQGTDIYKPENKIQGRILDLEEPLLNNIPFSMVYNYICSYVCGYMAAAGQQVQNATIMVRCLLCREGSCPLPKIRSVSGALSRTRSNAIPAFPPSAASLPGFPAQTLHYTPSGEAKQVGMNENNLGGGGYRKRKNQKARSNRKLKTRRLRKRRAD